MCNGGADSACPCCPLPGQDEALVVSLVQRHLKYTGSAVARALLADWQSAKAGFVKVFPHEYRHALETKAAAEVGFGKK